MWKVKQGIGYPVGFSFAAYGAYGSNARHLLSQIACKYPDAAAQTKVLGITITVGSTGQLTPTAALEPVTLDGVTIAAASCHNYRYVRCQGFLAGWLRGHDRRPGG